MRCRGFREPGGWRLGVLLNARRAAWEAASVKLRAALQRLLATVSLAAGRDRAALDHWQRAAALQPQDDRAAAAIGHLLCATDRSAEALGWLGMARRLAPGSAHHAFNHGFALQACALDADAIEAFDAAICCDPRFDRAYYGRALSQIRLGYEDAAIESLQTNTELQPMSPFGWYQLAHVQHRRGQIGNARATLARLAAFEPGVARQCAREIGLELSTLAGSSYPLAGSRQAGSHAARIL